MAKTAKKAPTRKPIKARGALPTPKVAPKRVRRKWYQRRETQMFGAVLVLVLLGVGLKVFTDVRKSTRSQADQVKATKRFDNKVTLAQTGMQDVFSGINSAPQDFKSGKMSADDFKKQTTIWLEKLRTLDAKLREPVPAVPAELQEAQAHFVDGTLIYIDAVKSFQIAGAAPDTATRDAAIQQGSNLISHGTAVYGLAQRLMQKLKLSLGIVKRSATTSDPLTGPIQLPQEEAPPPQPSGGQGLPPGTGSGGLPPAGVPTAP
ncbi:MAG: hypothetical protein ABR507_00815 [Actinomycetota bacterium]